MATSQRGIRQESEALIIQIDAYVADLRVRRAEVESILTEVEEAERVAQALRRLVMDTTAACAADRARVRAAVRYFVSQGAPRFVSNGVGRYGLPGLRRFNLRRNGHPSGADVRVVNDILRGMTGFDGTPAAGVG
jgi:hypothetical protein